MNRSSKFVMAALITVGAACLTVGVAGGAEPETAVSPSAASDSAVAGREVPADSLRVYRLNEVVVTADRLPADPGLYFSNVTIATRADLQQISSSTAGEALVIDSGLGLSRYGSYGSLQTLSARGGSSNEIVYLLDGVPISDPQVAPLDLNWLPRSGAARVEAMKGGASSVYGSGAIGGVVNVVSAEAAPEVPSTEVDFWNGSFGSRSVGVAFRRALAEGLGVLAAYDYTRSDGWVAHSASKGEKLCGKLAKDLFGLKTDAVWFRHTSEVQSPGCYPGSQNDRRNFFKISLARVADLGASLDYYHSASDQTYVSDAVCHFPQAGDSCCFAQSTYGHRGRIDGVRAEATRRSGDRWATSLGAGYERRWILSTSSVEMFSLGERSTHDLYASAHQEVDLRPWRLSGGLRVEKNSQFDLEVSPQVSAWLVLANGVTLFSKVDRSYAYPTFNDLYWRGPREAGDPNLKTEHSGGFEAGARLTRGRLELAATGYYRRVGDMILWRTDQPCMSVKSTNAQVSLAGADVSGRFRPLDGLEVWLSYWVGKATDRQTDRELEYRADNVLAWRVSVERRITEHVDAGAVFAGRRVPTVASGDQFSPPADSCGALCGGSLACRADTRLPGYSSALLYAYVGVDRGRVFGRINNIFDDVIFTSWGMPALPGRSYEVGLSLELRD
ncbi:MAG: TonB-dependent receptor [bacterium]